MSKRWNTSIALIGLMMATASMSVVAGNSSAVENDSIAPVERPAIEMSALYPRVGTWQVTIRTQPSGTATKVGIDKGLAIIKKGPGGFSIVQNFSSHGSDGDSVGESYTWWDAQSKQYKSVWCDNSQGCIEFITVIAGNSWSTELDGMTKSAKIHTIIRATMSADQNFIHEVVTNSYDGGPAKVETISDYHRDLAI